MFPGTKSCSKNFFHSLKKKEQQKSQFLALMREEKKKMERYIDIFVEFSQTKSLLTVVRIERDLSNFLGVKVELLTEASISPYFIDRIKNEAKVIST